MKKFLLISTLTFASVTAAFSQREAPDATTMLSDFTEGEKVYLYHVSSRFFLSYGNDWGTHATTNSTGIPVKFVATGETNDDGRPVYEITNYLPEKDAWYSSFLTTNDYDEKEVKTIHWYLDGSEDKTDRFFCIEPADGKTFLIYPSETNATVSHAGDFADYYLTLDPNYIDEKNGGVLTSSGCVYASASQMSQNDWAVMSEADYIAYQDQVSAYNHAAELLELINEAEELGIDGLDAAWAAYNNPALSYDEISQAITDLMALFTKFYEENVTPDSPIDMTRYLWSSDFEGSLYGWTDYIGLNTFELGNWDGMIDGTSYTGSNYLNMWNSSAANGEVSQEVVGLPNGVYGVTIAAHSDAEGGYIFAGGVKTAIKKGYIDEANNKRGQDYTVVTLVTDGTLELGYHSEHTGEFWSTMDNVRLMYYGAGEDAYKTWVEQSIAQAPDFTGARCQPAIIAAYNAALKALKEAELDENLMNYVNAFLAAINEVNENVQAYYELEETIASANYEIEQETLFPAYITLAQQYVTDVASPALEAVELDTEGVREIIGQLNYLIFEGFQTPQLFDELMAKDTYLDECIELYSSSASQDALDAARTLSAEVKSVIENAETAISNNDQIRELMVRIDNAIYQLRIPTGEASDDNPMDYSIYIVNPAFEIGLDGWVNEDDHIATFQAAGDWWDGVRAMSETGSAYLNLWDGAPNGYRVLQTIYNLPNGTYTMGVTAFADAANSAFVFAGSDNVLVQSADGLPGNAQRYEVTTKVTNGQLTIGVILHQNTVWCTFDDFTLTYYGSNSVRESSGDAFAEFAPVGVKGVEVAQPSQTDTMIFNLLGQRLNKVQKGVNIINGKKVLMK